jgi:hypothetical protein
MKMNEDGGRLMESGREGERDVKREKRSGEVRGREEERRERKKGRREKRGLTILMMDK